MSRIFIEESTLAAIGDSIRSKTGKTELIAPLDMPAEIASISGEGTGTGGGTETGEEAVLVPLTVTENGTYYPPTGTVELGNTYTFENDYPQELLKALYDEAEMKSEDGVYAYLFNLSDGATCGIMYQSGMYSAYISSGYIWLPEEYASQLGGPAGWYFGTDLTTLAPTDTPTAHIDENMFLHNGIELWHLITLFQVPEAADGFSSVTVNVASAGGSIDGVDAYIVTFIGADGSVLHTKPSVAGDDSYNPYTFGKIEMPTKESTAQYKYNFSGWSLTEGGSASATALDSITENRTVYAAFAEIVRTYTVRFWDGDTLMSETQVEYGAQATPPDHVKEGTIFLGWTPSDFTITGDTDFYGEWMEGISFESATWEQIKMVSESGEASNVFSIGDERTITMTWDDGTTEDCVIRIAAFDADTIYDAATGAAAGKAGITIDTKNVVSKTSASGMTSSVSYYASTLRTTMQNVIYPALPSDLQAVIKETYAPSASLCYDKVSALSPVNLGIYQDAINLSFPTVYATHYPIYTKATTLGANADDSRKKYNAAGEAVRYWVSARNSKINNASNKYTTAISEYGGIDTVYSTNEIYVAFRFAI